MLGPHWAVCVSLSGPQLTAPNPPAREATPCSRPSGQACAGGGAWTPRRAQKRERRAPRRARPAHHARDKKTHPGQLVAVLGAGRRGRRGGGGASTRAGVDVHGGRARHLVVERACVCVCVCGERVRASEAVSPLIVCFSGARGPATRPRWARRTPILIRPGHTHAQVMLNATSSELQAAKEGARDESGRGTAIRFLPSFSIHARSPPCRSPAVPAALAPSTHTHTHPTHAQPAPPPAPPPWPPWTPA